MTSQSNALHDALTAFARLAVDHGLPWLLIGGNAVVHYGVPRFTRDVDMFIPEDFRESWRELIEASGYRCIQSSDAFLQFDSLSPMKPPLDVMVVDQSTWERMDEASSVADFGEPEHSGGVRVAFDCA